MIRMNLSIANCRGQCYDGAANMAGHRSGVAAQILSVESRATYFVLKHYHNDFVASSLETQLELLPGMFSSLPEKPTLSTIRAYITGLSPATHIGISEVCILLKLILVIPATNAISERSASVLRRVKTYLRTSMSQMRVNNLCVLHAHKDRTDGLSIVSCLNDFVSSRERRFEVFGKF